MRHAAPQFPRCTLLRAAGLVLALAAGAVPARAGIDFWTPIGPYGGVIVALAASPAQPGLLYAASTDVGLFHSADGGATWVHLNPGLYAGIGLGYDVFALAVDPRAPSTVYVSDTYGFWKSVDAGATWAQLNLGEFSTTVWALAIDPQSPATLYAGTDTDVWKSTDGGASWTQEPTGFGRFTSLAVDPARPATVYAVSEGIASRRLLRSTDAGQTWSPRDAGLPLSPAPYFLTVQIAVDPSTAPGTVYAAFQGIASANIAASTYRSTDGGGTWQRSGAGGYPLAVGKGVVYAGALKSTDGGKSWMAAATPPDQTVVFLAAPGSGTTVYAGTFQQGVWRSGDAAASWQAASGGGLAATIVQALAIDPLHPRVLYAAAAGAVLGPGLLKSGNGGQTWRPAGPPWLANFVGGPLVIDPVNPSTLYTGSTAGLAKSADGGNSWEVLEGYTQDFCFGVSQLAIDPIHPANLFAAAAPERFSGCSNPIACPAWKSADGGKSWSCLGLAVQQVAGFFVAAGTPSTVYAIASFGFGSEGTLVNVFKSTDAGLSWNKVGLGGGHGGVDSILALAVDPTDADRVFAVADGGVFRTTDGGLTWHEYDHKLPVRTSAGSPVALAIDPHVPATVYAAGSWGVYRSTNSGLTWYPVNGGLPAVAFYPIFDPLLGFPLYEEVNGLLVLDPRQPGKLYAGTRHNGIYTYTVR